MPPNQNEPGSPVAGTTGTGITSGGSRVLTVKGAPMTAAQRAVANIALTAAQTAGASTTIMVAMIYAGIGESSLSASDTWQNSTGDSTATEAYLFLHGGGGFGDGALANSRANPTAPAWWIANDTERNAVFDSPAEHPWPGSTQAEADSYYNEAGGSAFLGEAEAIVQAFGGGSLDAGGVAGDGTSSGTSVNSTSDSSATNGFTMGSTSSPDQDFWTTINQLAQARQWYLFSDGETLYLADGPDLLQQAPAISIDRWADASRIIHLDFTWDNTAFQYTVNRKKARARTVRKSVLSKVQSPVTATLDVVCDIDEVRAGDVIYLSGCGPGNGKWLVGDCTRSVFSIYSELTLVPPMAPLSEKEAAGSSPSGVLGAAASAPGSGTAMANMLSAASTISNAQIPYVYGGGHGTAGTPSIGIPGDGYDGVTKGYDCSGSVGAVLHAGGFMNGSVPESGGFPAIPSLKEVLVPGKGSGSPECTIYVASFHIMMTLNGQSWGASTGGGGRLNGAPTGPTWYQKGAAAPNENDPQFTPYHFPQSILGVVNSNGAGTGTTFTMFDTSDTPAAPTIDKISKSPYAVAGYMDGNYNNYAGLVTAYPGARHLSLATQASTDPRGANGGDFEGEDLDPSNAGSFVTRALTSGNQRPVVYSSLTNMGTVKASLSGAGLSRGQYRLWVADWTGSAHIPAGYDACQWADPAHGPTPSINVDYTEVQSNFFD